MNESDLATLLERSSAELDPDLERIVSGAAVRGRRTVLRRRIGAGIAVAALAVATGVGVTAVAGGPDGRQGVDIATAPERASGAMPFTDPQRELAPRDELRERLLALLPDGEVSDVTVTGYGPGAEWGRDAGVEISLLFNGAAVGFHLVDQTFDREAWAPPAPGERPDGCRAEWAEKSWRWLSRFSLNSPNDPATRACLQWVAVSLDHACSESPDCTPRYARATRDLCPECVQQADGSWLWARSGGGGDGSPSAMAGNWATRYTVDGWEVHADAFNVVDDDAMEPERVADEPVLTLEQVTAIASSDVWFE